MRAGSDLEKNRVVVDHLPRSERREVRIESKAGDAPTAIVLTEE